MPGAPHSRALLHRHHRNGRLNPTHRLMNVRPDGWCGGPDQGEADVGLVFCVSGCVGSDLFEVCPEPLDPGAAVAGIALRRRGCAAGGGSGARRTALAPARLGGPRGLPRPPRPGAGPGGQPQGRCRRPLPPFGVGSVRAEMLSTDGFGPSQATETAPDIGPHTPGRAHRATPVRQVVWGPWRSAIPARAAHHPARPVRPGRQKRCDGGPREARQRAASMRPFSFR